MGVGLTEIRQAIDKALEKLAMRYSFLEEDSTREEIATAIHTAVAQALREKMEKKEMDVAIMEEMLGAMLEELHRKIYSEHAELAGVMGTVSGRIKNEIRHHVAKILEELKRIKYEVEEVGGKVEKAEETVKDIAYLRQRFGY